jgi:hypothetical protein
MQRHYRGRRRKKEEGRREGGGEESKGAGECEEEFEGEGEVEGGFGCEFFGFFFYLLSLLVC